MLIRWLLVLTLCGSIGASTLASLEEAWRADPANYANGYNLALAYLENGQSEKSRTVIEALLRRDDKAELHNLLGDVEEAEGHVNDAAKQYEIAARQDPSEKNVFDLGSDLLKHRGFDPALKVLEFGVGRYPRSARMRVGLGIAYYSLGQYDRAVQTLCEAVDLDPKDTKALDFLGKMIDVSPDDAENVRQRLGRFAKLYPNNSAANFYYALSLRSSQPDVAERYFDRSLELKPDYALGHFQLGLLYENKKRDPEAIREFQLAVKYDPDMVKAHYRLAQLYQKAGMRELAQEEFQRVEALKSGK